MDKIFRKEQNTRAFTVIKWPCFWTSSYKLYRAFLSWLNPLDVFGDSSEKQPESYLLPALAFFLAFMR